MKCERFSSEIVVFDVDGTLVPDTPDDNSGQAFWRLTEEGVFHSSDETLQELTALRQAVVDDPTIDKHDYCNSLVKEYDSQICGAPIAKVMRVYKELVDQAVDEHIYPELSDEIEFWKDYGAKLAIISGSPDGIVQLLKRHLGFDIATGTRHFRQGGMYHPSRRAVSRGAEKHLIVEKMRRSIGEEAIFSAAYGDTINDLSMLKAAAIPVAVNPKPSLYEHAQAHDWEILRTASFGDTKAA